MKKSTVRIFAIVLAALMCLSLLPLTVAHAEEHVHVFEPTTIPPTCGEEGYVQMICEACGFGTEILEFIPPTGEHVFASVLGDDYLFQTSDNICETPEVYWKSCTVCGAPAEEAYELAKQRALDELNQRRANGEEHSDAEWQDMMQRVLDDIWANYTFTYGGEGHAWVAYDGQEATCEQDGWKPYRMCANCGAVEDYEVVPAKGHRWGEQTVVTEPTCDTEGLRRRVCEVCGKEDNEIIPALGHKYGEAAVIKAPTCTEDGMQQRVCSVCGAKADEVIPALGHKFGAYAVIKPATCTEDGVQERVCSVCGTKETEAIPAAHKFGEYVVTVEPGCYSSGEQVRTCTVCGATESMSIPAAHKFGAFVVTMEPTCYSTGERRSTCTVCGEEIVEWVDTAHKYENGVCVFCGEPAPEGYVAPAVEAAAVAETENTTETQGLILSDSETFDAASFNVTLTNTNETTINDYPGYSIALIRDTVDDSDVVKAECDLGRTDLIYTWSYGDSSGEREIVRGVNLTEYNVGDTSGGKPNLLDKYLFCVVTDPTDPNPLTNSKRSDNIRIRREVTLSFQAYSGKATISCKRDTLDREALVVEAADNVYNDDYRTYLTQDKITLHLDPNDGYLFRQIAYLDESSNVWVPQRTLADTNRDLELTVTTGTRKIWLLMADKADLYHSIDNNSEKPTNDEDDNIQKSNTKDKELETLLANLGTQYGVKPENISTSVIVYVTPVWSTGKLAMNDAEIANTDGFQFRLPFPEDITKDDKVLAYHFDGNSTAGQWVVIPNSQLNMTDSVYVSNFKSFSPFVTVGLKNVKLILSPSETAAPEETTSETHYKGAIVKAPVCTFTAPAGKTLDEDKYWLGSDGKNYKPGADLPELKGDFTLTAQWIDGYTITFDKNDTNANGSMEPQRFPANSSTKALSTNVFTLKNNDFVGWSTTPDGEKVYDDGEEITPTENIKLYAVWNRSYSTVTLDPNNDGADKTVEQTAPKNGSLTLKTIKELSFTNGNKLFAGWSTAEAPDTIAYQDGQTISTPNTDITLRAVWRNPVVISFYPNSDKSSDSMKTQEIPSGKPVELNANTFKATGMRFLGWSTSQDGTTGTTYENKETVTLTGDTSLYAQWERNIFTVTFDKGADGATGTMIAQEIENGVSTKLTKNAFTYTDYEFVNWLGSDGNTYADGQAISSITNDLTLTAQWKRVTFNVTFNNGGADGTETMEVQKITNGVPTKLTRNAYTYTKHQFREWKDQDGKTYKDQKEITEITKDLTLTAQWDELVTVTFNANNGNSEETKIQQEVKGSTAKLTAISGLGFTAQTNMEFDCWNTVQEPTTENPGTKYGDAASFTFSADTTLYAQWKPIVVTIRFEPGDGSRSTSTAMPPITVNAGDAQKLPKMSGFTLARHSFIGWSATAEGAVLYADEASVPATATAAAGKTTSRTITLYARWKQTTFTISFDPSGGSGTMAAQNIDKNTQTSLTLRPNRFVKTVNDGESTITYKFMGWTTTSGGTTVIYEDGETIPADDIDKDMTLYAVWDTVIIFKAPDADAGSTMTPQSYDPKADTVTLKANTFTRENYRFESWRGDDGNTYANQETLYKDSATLTADKHKIPQSPLTLTAVWTRVSYAVSYDPNGGGGTMDAQSVQVGQSVTLKDSEFTAKPGMIFGNWNTARDGSGSTFAPGATVMPTGDVTLYAQWKDPVNVYYYPGTGDGTYKIVEVPKDVETALKSPTDADLGYTAPAGQTFAHWKNNVTGDIYRRNQKVTFSDDVSLTAVYADTIAISYDPNGGSLSVNGTTSTTARKFAAPKGEPYTLYTAEQLHLTRSGYEFKGWGQSESDRSPDYTDGGTYTFDGDKELFAIWQKHTFDGGVLVSGEISGIGYAAYVGETLTATAYDDYWKEFNYKWVRDDGMILRDSTYDYKKDGIDTSNVDWTTYVVQEDDYGHDIYCEVTAKGDEADTSIVKRSNVKTVTVEEDTKRIVNNGNTEQDYVYGLTSDMTYTVNSTDSSKGTKVVLDTYGRFAVTQSGTYRFYKKGTLQATVYVENWYTIGYATNGSGTVSLKLDNTSLTSSTRTFTGDLADKIEYYPHISGFTCWIVKEGASIGTFTLTVQGSSSNYTHVYLNEKLLDSFGSTTRTTTTSSSSSTRTTTTSSSSSSSTSTSRTYTVSTPLERDTRYTTAPWKMFEIVFNSTSSTSSPRTGDASNLGLWSALCLTSVTGTAAVLTTARKRRKSKG